jgi:hypothetical protein
MENAADQEYIIRSAVLRVYLSFIAITSAMVKASGDEREMRGDMHANDTTAPQTSKEELTAPALKPGKGRKL